MAVSHDMSKAYLNQLQAPIKGFYTFDQSAHSPIFKNPGMIYILQQDVLAGTNRLSDKG